MKKLKPITSSFDYCARCGKTHKDIKFTPFKRPNKHYTHWAPCPTNGDPILLKTIET